MGPRWGAGERYRDGMDDRTVPARIPSRSSVSVPYLEPAVGIVWWTLGAAALDGGVGTVALAAGLGVTAAMVLALRRRHGAGSPLPRGGLGRLLRLAGITVAMIAVASTVLGFVGFGELMVPVACAIVGVALFPASSLLGARTLLGAGSVLLVLGAGGALLALNSAGLLLPQGLVGLVAGAVLWVEGAHRSGLINELAGRARR